MATEEITSRRVVALADSSRVEGFWAQPAAAGFTVFTAYDGRTGSTPDDFDRAGFEARRGMAPSGGEVGCAVSHYRLLKEFAEQDGEDSDLILVAEDDARFGPDFELVLDNILGRISSFDCIILASPFDDAGSRPLSSIGARLTQLSLLASPVGPKGRLWCYRVGAYWGSAWGTGLYLMRRSAARRYVDLAALIQGIEWVADESSYWAPLARIRMACVVPNIAGWEGPSTIRETSDIAAAHERAQRRRGRVEAFRSLIAIRTRWRFFRRQLAGTGRDLNGRRARRKH